VRGDIPPIGFLREFSNERMEVEAPLKSRSRGVLWIFVNMDGFWGGRKIDTEGVTKGRTSPLKGKI